jgi:hypothetical protein
MFATRQRYLQMDDLFQCSGRAASTPGGMSQVLTRSFESGKVVAFGKPTTKHLRITLVTYDSDLFV